MLRSIRNELPVAGSVGRLYKVKWKWHNKKNNIPWHFTFEEGTGGADSEWQQSDRGRFDGAVTRRIKVLINRQKILNLKKRLHSTVMCAIIIRQSGNSTCE